MRFDLKDYLGIAVVAAAVGVLAVHEGDEHQQVHVEAPTPAHAAANARRAAVNAIAESDAISEVTVFSDFTLADRDGHPVADHQTIIVRHGEIAWVGPSGGADIPGDARVFHGEGTHFLLPADHATSPIGRTLQTGDSADVLVVSDDPVLKPEALDKPLAVMRQGVVVSLSPSLAAAG